MGKRLKLREFRDLFIIEKLFLKIKFNPSRRRKN